MGLFPQVFPYLSKNVTDDYLIAPRELWMAKQKFVSCVSISKLEVSTCMYFGWTGKLFWRAENQISYEVVANISFPLGSPVRGCFLESGEIPNGKYLLKKKSVCLLCDSLDDCLIPRGGKSPLQNRRPFLQQLPWFKRSSIKCQERRAVLAINLLDMSGQRVKFHASSTSNIRGIFIFWFFL